MQHVGNGGCLFLFLFFFFVLFCWGAGGAFGLIDRRSINSFPLFFFSFFLFLVDLLILDEILKETSNPKQQIYQPFRVINSKITKSDRILDFFFKFNIVLPGKENERVCRKIPQELTQFSPRSHPIHLMGKEQHKTRHHQRHHKRQPSEQPFPIQVVTG